MVMDPAIAHEMLSYMVPGAVIAIVSITVGGPIASAIARRIANAPPRAGLPTAADADTRARLERIEQAVETIAVEVERMAEAQRFAAQLEAKRTTALPKG